MPGLTGSRAAASVQEETQAHVRCKEAVLPGMLAWAPAQVFGMPTGMQLRRKGRKHMLAASKLCGWACLPACLAQLF